MNTIWFFMIITSCVMLIFKNPDTIINALLEASTSSFELCLSLVGIYAVWLGIISIVDKCGLGEKLSNFLSPIIKKLFKTNNKEADKYIAINLSSNILGLGNAATPSGIKAMQLLDDKSGKITHSGIVLLLINSISIQILPTTIIGLRQTAGSTNPTNIILPTIITSFFTLIFVLFCIFLIEKLRAKKI